MSSCVKDLFDYDLVKVCSKCRIVQMRTNFHKNNQSLDGLRSICKSCCRIYYIENRDHQLEYSKRYSKRYQEQNREKILEYMKRYNQEHREQHCEYQKNRRQTDLMYKFATNLRSRTYYAFKTQNVIKNNKTLDLLGCSQQFFKNWIEFQLYGDMTLDNYGQVWHIDHCLPVSSFDLFNEDEMKRCFNWKNLRPMYSKDNIEKRDKINIRLYLLQEIKSNYFLKM